MQLKGSAQRITGGLDRAKRSIFARDPWQTEWLFRQPVATECPQEAPTPQRAKSPGNLKVIFPEGGAEPRHRDFSRRATVQVRNRFRHLTDILTAIAPSLQEAASATKAVREAMERVKGIEPSS